MPGRGFAWEGGAMMWKMTGGIVWTKGLMLLSMNFAEYLKEILRVVSCKSWGEILLTPFPAPTHRKDWHFPFQTKDVSARKDGCALRHLARKLLDLLSWNRDWGLNNAQDLAKGNINTTQIFIRRRDEQAWRPEEDPPIRDQLPILWNLSL